MLNACTHAAKTHPYISPQQTASQPLVHAPMHTLLSSTKLSVLSAALAAMCRYDPLLALSPEMYVSALEAKGEDLTITELRSELRKAQAEYEVLNEALPQGVNLGLVHLSLVKTRELLLKKQEKLVTLLKGLAARVPRKAIAAVSAKFAELDKQVKTKANTIEDVDNQRKFIEALPAKVRCCGAGRCKLQLLVECSACSRSWLYSSLHVYVIHVQHLSSPAATSTITAPGKV